LSDMNSDNTKMVLALCPDGKQALGGGAQIGGPVNVALNVSDFYLDGNGNRIGWIAQASEVNSTNFSWVLVAHALCATVG
jgi:hypothetical protein